MSRFELPPGESTADPRWQEGYHDGENVLLPRQINPVYVSGWCHGYCGAFQTSAEAAEAAYDAQQDNLARPAE